MRILEPLSRDELQRLWRWERHMTRFHAAAMTLLALCAAAAFVWSDIVWVRRLLLAIVLLLVAAATMLQLREKCPRCGSRKWHVTHRRSGSPTLSASIEALESSRAARASR